MPRPGLTLRDYPLGGSGLQSARRGRRTFGFSSLLVEPRRCFLAYLAVSLDAPPVVGASQDPQFRCPRRVGGAQGRTDGLCPGLTLAGVVSPALFVNAGQAPAEHNLAARVEIAHSLRQQD